MPQAYSLCHLTLRDKVTSELLGCGWLVDPLTIVTCAHVLQNPNGHTYREEVSAWLTFCTGSPFDAHVTKVNEGEVRGNDLALLAPTSASGTLNAPSSGILSPLSGERCRCLGVPTEWDGIGNWAYYVVGDVLPNGWTQLIGEGETGFQIRAGFSGAPVWDDDRQSTIGIVVGNDTNMATRSAFMISSDRIASWMGLGGFEKLPFFDSWIVQKAEELKTSTLEDSLLVLMSDGLSSPVDAQQRRWIYEALKKFNSDKSRQLLSDAACSETDSFARRAFEQL